MKATNANPVVDDDKEVTVEDLRKLKEESGVESSKETDESLESETQEESKETGEEDQTSDSQTEETEEESKDESAEESPEFVKAFPNIKGDTPEEYAKNLEIAYNNSTSEALRLKDLVKAPETQEEEIVVDTTDPVALFMKQKMDEEINTAFTDFSATYSQVQDPTEYAKFVDVVGILSQTILNSQKRLASPSELYAKAAVILGWKPEAMDDKDNLNAAINNNAAISKTVSATKPKSTSKVTDAQIIIAKEMGGWTEGKSDSEIRKELEPHIN